MTRLAGNAARDALVIARIAASDESALAELIAWYGQTLRDFAYLTVHDVDLAADVVQEIFVSLWHRRETLSILGTVADYLYRATRNRALTVLKHEAVQHRLQSASDQPFAINLEAVSDAADAHLATREFGNAVDAALRSLTPRVREAFLMRHVYEMSYAEIAATLDVTVATVQSQVSRAARQISEYLEPFR